MGQMHLSTTDTKLSLCTIQEYENCHLYNGSRLQTGVGSNSDYNCPHMLIIVVFDSDVM